MIPATTPYEAHYAGRDGMPGAIKPVIAWDDDGHPLVAGEHRLVRADTWRNYEGIHEAKSPVIAAIPGGGFIAHYRQDDGTLMACPLVCWLVRADGSIEPQDVDDSGWCDGPAESSNFSHISHPAS